MLKRYLIVASSTALAMGLVNPTFAAPQDFTCTAERQAQIAKIEISSACFAAPPPADRSAPNGRRRGGASRVRLH
ncbi:hypothetical protein [Coleofasciculus sp. FACHB-1120]|uniref:hypothetical protein n=1 Tax=Coleofasciculus sp. FACHB-1120 TaxID=2692783 RepID=UPI001684AE7D|nr:hypothetical protein [Coleofasciculus sp. FACHB-1120]MBD2744528.1 hypothetical protein [Coleofasciculus sp. FACHB-1120]